ncbi:MAG: metalloregulator ArsR/SmtB family transcription factor [Patescibacteria group bacterium]|uniref:Winged helix-turn-helix transcriptional regulator n=1 Tax=candidate division WWE3 bacterium TaxID=2053526 RepID=A0A955EBR6_UNCKA|nr:winged helix-turn-helix transcriptional regulator [candidate division WWE3 bacterium]
MQQSRKISKALSDNNRVLIMEMLSQGDKNVSKVAEDLNVEENLASHHLRVLSAAGFLQSTKKGREVYYSIHKKKLINIIKTLKKNPIFYEILAEAIKD